jgi:hypothetical protein
MNDATPQMTPRVTSQMSEADLEQLIEARAAQLAEGQALYWRIRLVAIETILLGTLVFITGIAIGEPLGLVLRAAVMVAAGCLASGMILIALTDAANHGLKRLASRRKPS